MSSERRIAKMKLGNYAKWKSRIGRMESENGINMLWFAIATGIVGGLVTTGILWLVRVIWKDRVEPWWENLVYKDIRLDGATWHAILDSELVERYEEDVTLSQIGHRVYGSITCVEGPETDKNRSYEFSGSFRNSILSATYFATDRSALDCGSFTLQLKENGNKLEGYVLYYFNPDHSIRSRPYQWTRTSGGVRRQM